MIIQENLTIGEKLKILTDAAKYDVSCTSSGVSRRGRRDGLGNAEAAGICHSFSADGRCISLLKILYTNQCIYDCKYCINRCHNNTLRTAFTPEEVCTLTMEFYRRNYIEGLFLSSGILYNADYTMERIFETLYKLRTKYRFNGYIHVKAIPGASPELIQRTGYLADRMSVNLELPTAQGLKKLAPGKTRDKILRPMRQIQRGIAAQSLYLEGDRDFKPAYPTRKAGFGGGAALFDPVRSSTLEVKNPAQEVQTGTESPVFHEDSLLGLPSDRYGSRQFVPAGQSTQMIVGATPESDYQMMLVTQALYRSYGLKRVFYSAYVPVNQDDCLPAPPGGPPLMREHRLYQADWLLRFYGFQAEELLSEEQPNFNVFLDPKCDWALRHLEHFPVEVNQADYASLLRIPGVGVKSARRILSARRQGELKFPDLKKFGVVMKRAAYFISCSGKMMPGARIDQDYITSCLVGEEKRNVWDITHKDCYRQLSLFDDMKLEMPVERSEFTATAVGSL